ncbi:MAG: SUF system Fe-S cluster assembly regulator [Sphingomonadaceae bacterium]
MASMLRLTNLADYAVVVMSAAARSGTCTSAASIARSTGLPVATVAKLLNLLARGGLLTSTRGAAGGFRLARPAEAISLVDIVEAIDGPVALTHCAVHGPQSCDVGEACCVSPHWPLINRAVRDALASVSLATLAALPAPALAQVREPA